jgi:2-dehydro-3-deoxyphosphogluconate aldolase/(4S)-4-hydroxy-2-oxoglutarate aldolase
MAARRLGLGVVKFFPAGVAGGPDALQALHAPFPDMAFVPTGGVRPDTLDRYLSLPGVPAVGGTWLAPGDLLRAGDFAAIEDRVRAAVAAVAALSRSPGHPGRDGVAAAPTRTGSGATDRG